MLIIIGLPFILIFSALVLNWLRVLRTHKINLRPNCLITRYPITFLSGKQSPFYFGKYWNNLPEYLAEHGYEVNTLNLPSRSTELRSLKLDAILKTQKQPLHLFCDCSTIIEDLPVLKKYSTICKSINVFTTQDAPKEISNIKNLYIHKVTRLNSKSLPFDYTSLGHKLITGPNDRSDLQHLNLMEQKQFDFMAGQYLKSAISLAEHDLMHSK